MKQNSKNAQITEQKKKLSKQIEEWVNEDLNNRSAIVILGDRKDLEDAGCSSLLLMGLGNLLMNSLGNAISSSKPLENMVLLTARNKAFESILKGLEKM